ncbi:MAG: DUF86 domain-containing protein [Candidatus Sumerlaeota bacterium]|nr:DUF86 domain-containing protein [Candidatus Sumerlaeota bacterium]
MPRDQASVLDMVNAARLALEFTHGMEKEAFWADVKTQSAVIHQLLILGEAAHRLTISYRTRHARIPWPQIISMRNRMIHEYDEVDLEEVWKTLQADLPSLLSKLERMLESG